MTGQRQKVPDALADRRPGRYAPLVPIASGWQHPIPKLPQTIKDKGVRAVWRDLWTSQLAGVFKPTDVPTLLRWAWWLDQWFRAAREVRSESITIRGANGPTLNPTIRYLKQCETALRELEKAFGMDALARLRLGITLADGQAKAAALRQPSTPRAM